MDDGQKPKRKKKDVNSADDGNTKTPPKSAKVSKRPTAAKSKPKPKSKATVKSQSAGSAPRRVKKTIQKVPEKPASTKPKKPKASKKEKKGKKKDQAAKRDQTLETETLETETPEGLETDTPETSAPEQSSGVTRKRRAPVNASLDPCDHGLQAPRPKRTEVEPKTDAVRSPAMSGGHDSQDTLWQFGCNNFDAKLHATVHTSIYIYIQCLCLDNSIYVYIYIYI